MTDFCSQLHCSSPHLPLAADFIPLALYTTIPPLNLIKWLFAKYEKGSLKGCWWFYRTFYKTYVRQFNNPACHTAPDVSLLQPYPPPRPGRHQGAIAETNYEINNLGAHVGVSKVCPELESPVPLTSSQWVSLNCSVVVRSGYRRISRKTHFKVTVCRLDVIKPEEMGDTHLAAVLARKTLPLKE